LRHSSACPGPGRRTAWATSAARPNSQASIAALEAQVAEQSEERDRVQASMVSYLPEAHGPAYTDGCGSCRGSCGAVGRDFFNEGCRGCGYYDGAEIIWLKPFAAGLGAVFIDGASASR
jgi:hypothetical protein